MLERRVSRPNPYHRLSISAKQARHREAMREPSIACPHCDTQTTAADLLRHLEACSGRREPHPLSKWVTWSEALALGVARDTLSRWVRQGRVRSRVSVRVDGERNRGRPARRRYLLRDVTKLLALRKRISPNSRTNS
jgi:hypothetical protein